MAIRDFLDGFFALNKKASRRLMPFLPAARANLKRSYELEIGRLIREHQPEVVVDMGGGKQCHYAQSLTPDRRPLLIAVDIEEESVQENEDVDARVVADLSRGIPMASESADLVTSRVTIEHLPDLEKFFREVRRVLRPGGYSVHMFPGRYSSFATISRLLGDRMSRNVLFFLRPKTKGTCGYRAFYDRTNYSAVRRMHAKLGLDVQSVEVAFHASDYYTFFLPFFLLSASYETIISWLGVKNLAAYLLVVARKPVAPSLAASPHWTSGLASHGAIELPSHR
jgi:ubiquinone/menaquinone biosynthesis C-methylase UbiE